MRYVLTVGLGLLLAACSSKKEESARPETGVDINKNPLGVIGALGNIASDMESFQKEIENMKAVETVHFSTLLAALPDPPAGWNADEPKGSTTQLGDFKTSEAHRVYTSGTGQEVEVTIQDWAFHRAVYLPFLMAARLSQESSDGYNRGIRIAGDPGREEYQTESKSGERTVLRKKRYCTKIRIEGLPASAFDEWYARVKVDALPAGSQTSPN